MQRFCGRGRIVSTTSVLFTSLLSSLLGSLFIRQSDAIGVSFEASQSDTKPFCASTDVRGLEYCPQLINLLPTLVENKRALLRLAMDALTGMIPVATVH